LFLKTNFAGKTAGIGGFKTQNGSMSSDRPIEDANQARGIRDKFDVTNVAIQCASRVEYLSRCPYSNLRMRTADYRSIYAVLEPMPAACQSVRRPRRSDTCRDVALIRAFRCEAVPASLAEIDHADCGML